MPDDTEIMSTYLQRGATMLGEHCDDCNNPLFRVQGEEVCVVCHAHEQEGAAEATESDGLAGTGDERDRGGASGGASTHEAEADAGNRTADDDPLTGGRDAPLDEIRRNVLAVARRVSREARDERELARLDDRMRVLERCAEVLDDLG